MNLKLHRAALRAGYCCLYALLWDTAHMKTAALAAVLNVTPRCIRQRRRAFRLGLIRCQRTGAAEESPEALHAVVMAAAFDPPQCRGIAGATAGSAADLVLPTAFHAHEP